MDLVTMIATGASVVAAAITGAVAGARAASGAPAQHAPGAMVLPPAPRQPSPSLLDADLPALAVEVATLKRTVEQIQNDIGPLVEKAAKRANTKLVEDLTAAFTRAAHHAKGESDGDEERRRSSGG